MSTRTKLTTILIVGMLVLSVVAVAAPTALAEDDDNQVVEILDNDEDLYLVFGADLGDTSIEEYVEAQASAENPADRNSSSVVQYQDVNQVNIKVNAEAVAIGMDGGQATAIQETSQQNTNVQDGEATAENHPMDNYDAEFKEVGNVYVVFGDGDDQRFDGWATVDDDATVTQVADAGVTQQQVVGQANVNERTTALALAENDSTATAVQQIRQSNQNLQEGAATATNVFADDVDEKKDRHEKHKKHDDEGPLGEQAAEATVEQGQAITQLNVDEYGSAVAIAVGENASATAVQITDQSNLNQQVGFAEAVNIMMESSGMHVATAGSGAGDDILSQDGEEWLKPDKKKGDDADEHADGDLTQLAEADVTQYQGVEQANINLNSSAMAIATNGSDATSIQLIFQQNLNAQVASAEALNVFENVDEKKHDRVEMEDYEHVDHFYTNSTTVSIGDNPVDGVDHMAFDYDGGNDQLNAVDQYSTAEVEQSQNITQANLNSQATLAVADGDGSAQAFQLVMQQNENVQFTSSEETSVVKDAIDDEEPKDHDKDDERDHDKDDERDHDHDKDDERDHDHDKDDERDHDKDDHSTETDDDSSDRIGPSDDDDDAVDEETEDTIPGFGVLVALVALGIVGAARFVSNR